AGQLPEEELGDVFLVIDNWPALRQEWETAEASICDIAARGLGFGIHVIVTANQWMDMRRLSDSMSGRLELRLNRPADSAVDRRGAANVPPVPGRGLTSEGLHFQACLPRFDGRSSTEDLAPAAAGLVARIREAWPGPQAPPVRLLPPVLPFTDLPAPGVDGDAGVPVGVRERDLAPVYLDLTGADPHFLVFGDGESGKTGFLKALLTGLTARLGPEQARVLVVDYRRGLLDAVHPAHLFAYAGAAPAAAAEVARLRQVVAARMPGAEVCGRQLRERSWWSGPDFYVVVDDYDLVVTPGGNPMSPLLDLLAQGRDLGLHLVVARRVAGASRAVFEPVLQRLKELASPGLILSGDRQEGPLIGPHRAAERVPGRGLLVRRKHQPELVQVAWVPV
ncbi:MAG TPA: type VII secretion protein EccCb, partial [Acidimicrobiales bacterium]|nr:type VII secretion protein EccCb [Acidimicrobiales bacterium]